MQGGDLVFGIEADTANPWAPYRTSCATACYVMITSVSDPLFTATADGEIAPILVESFEPNADSTEWTFTSATASRSTTARRSTARPSSSTWSRASTRR